MSPRTRTPSALRHYAPGAVRAAEPGTALGTLLLAPAPDWVALDLESGALVRSSNRANEVHAALSGGPLEPVVIEIAGDGDPWDPSRPEAVEVLGAEDGVPPSRRAVRRLLANVVSRSLEQGLLGSIGPTVAFAELAGDRGSVALVAPESVSLATREGIVAGELDEETATPPATVARFRLGGQDQVLPVVPRAVAWVEGGLVPSVQGKRRGRGRAEREEAGEGPKGGRHRASRGRSGHRWAAPGGRLAAVTDLVGPVLLVVGLQAPERSQVRKAVLGIVPLP